MEGLKILYNLNPEQQKAISERYGSPLQLYQLIFGLNAEDYTLHTTKPENYKEKQSQIQEKLYDLEDELDELGVPGDLIVAEITSDHSEIIVKKRIDVLDEYLKQFGTNFEAARNWMRDTYGI